MTVVGFSSPYCRAEREDEAQLPAQYQHVFNTVTYYTSSHVMISINHVQMGRMGK